MLAERRPQGAGDGRRHLGRPAPQHGASVVLEPVGQDVEQRSGGAVVAGPVGGRRGSAQHAALPADRRRLRPTRAGRPGRGGRPRQRAGAGPGPAGSSPAGWPSSPARCCGTRRTSACTCRRRMPRPHEGPPRPGYGPADEAPCPDRALIPPAARPAGGQLGREPHLPGTDAAPPDPRLEELQEIVARASNLRVLGSRHSFSAIADADELISPRGVGFPCDRRPCRRDRVAGGRDDLWRARRAFGRRGPGAAQPRFAAAHLGRRRGGDGARTGPASRNGNLATAVRSLELVTSSGEVHDDVEGRPRLRRRGGRPRRAGRGHPDHPRRASRPSRSANGCSRA